MVSALKIQCPTLVFCVSMYICTFGNPATYTYTGLNNEHEHKHTCTFFFCFNHTYFVKVGFKKNLEMIHVQCTSKICFIFLCKTRKFNLLHFVRALPTTEGYFHQSLHHHHHHPYLCHPSDQQIVLLVLNNIKVFQTNRLHSNSVFITGLAIHLHVYTNNQKELHSCMWKM